MKIEIFAAIGYSALIILMQLFFILYRVNKGAICNKCGENVHTISGSLWKANYICKNDCYLEDSEINKDELNDEL